jgi:hypothetical protein
MGSIFSTQSKGYLSQTSQNSRSSNSNSRGRLIESQQSIITNMSQSKYHNEFNNLTSQRSSGITSSNCMGLNMEMPNNYGL